MDKGWNPCHRVGGTFSALERLHFGTPAAAHPQSLFNTLWYCVSTKLNRTNSSFCWWELLVGVTEACTLSQPRQQTTLRLLSQFPLFQNILHLLLIARISRQIMHIFILFHFCNLIWTSSTHHGHKLVYSAKLRKLAVGEKQFYH